ncbi:MAG: transketolase, partial [Patescibacteria group bacterium]
VYVIESDGGMQVGINYEAISFAKQHKLDNLTLIVDYNGLQAMGATKDILDMSNLRDELLSFGWATMEIDGHDFEQIEFALNQKTDEPFAVIANTIKGKGVSFMEGENLYHYKQLSVEEYEEAKKELYG